MKNGGNRRLVVIACVLLIAAVGAGFGFRRHEVNEDKSLDVVAVTRGTLQEIVTAQGKLEPKDYVDVGVQISGQLKKLYVEIGSVVKMGDLVAEIDPAPYKSKFAADEARLNSLKAQLEQQKADNELNISLFDRATELYKFNGISKQDLDTKASTLKKSEASIKSYVAQIAEAQANLDLDKINIGYTKIYAPMDGVVSDQIAREGQTLNANQTTPKLIQVANLNIMTVRVQVAEADIMRLKPDMEASFSTLGSNDKKWKGVVRQILPTPEIINDVVLYDVLIDVENNDHMLMNGMSTQVFFETAHADNVLVLPARALDKRLADKDGEQGAAYNVKVQVDGKTRDRVIHVGLMTRTEAEVRDGLAEGDKVVVPETGRTSGTGKRTQGPQIGPRI